MSDDLTERLEILVHSAAPTSKKEDDRLRAQALACLGFQPTKRTFLTDINFTRKRARLSEGVYSDTQESRGSQARAQARKSRERDSQRQEAETKKQHLKVSQASKFTSRITRSTPDGFVKELERSVKSSEHRVIQGLLSQAVDAETSSIDLTPSNQSPPRSEGLPHLPTPYEEDEPPSSYATSRFDSWESPPGSIPDSQPFNNEPLLPVISPFEPPGVPSPSEDEAGETGPSDLLLTISGLSFCYAPPPPTSNSLAPVSPHHESSLALSEYSLSSLNSESYPFSPRLPEFNPSFALKTLIEGPYEILSPYPTTDSNPPLITRQLREMTNVSDGKLMVEKYQKLKKWQVRELRKWERGYWRVDTSSWANIKAKVHFWNLLKDYVVNGRLGSVNVFLDGEEGALVKIYCFGGMVEHLWCALFVMSSRNLKNTTWIDAGDNEVIKF